MRRTMLQTGGGALVLTLLVLVAGCRDEAPPPDYVARVGPSYLTAAELESTMVALNVRPDSAEARRQLVEQWSTTELLVQEARRRNLQNDPEVRRQLRESERALLVDALVRELQAEEDTEPTAGDLQAYFERHKEQLRLREPYVRIRYLPVASEDSARAAAEELRRLDASSTADSTWEVLVDRYSADPDGSRQLSDHFFPERRLFTGDAQLRSALGALRAGATSPVIAHQGTYHLLQLVERAPAGTIPDPSWIRDELRQRLAIQTRKQLYARQVQRLRNEARARDAFEMR